MVMKFPGKKKGKLEGIIRLLHMKNWIILFSEITERKVSLITVVINAHSRFNHKVFNHTTNHSTNWRFSLFDDEGII